MSVIRGGGSAVGEGLFEVIWTAALVVEEGIVKGLWLTRRSPQLTGGSLVFTLPSSIPK